MISDIHTGFARTHFRWRVWVFGNAPRSSMRTLRKPHSDVPSGEGTTGESLDVDSDEVAALRGALSAPDNCASVPASGPLGGCANATDCGAIGSLGATEDGSLSSCERVGLAEDG